jgi:hypothetical protein
LARALADDLFFAELLFVKLFFVELFMDMVLTMGRLIVLEPPDREVVFDALDRDEEVPPRLEEVDVLPLLEEVDVPDLKEEFDLLTLGAGTLPLTTSWKPFSGVMWGFLAAGILIACPVAELRPLRALVCTRSNLAKPVTRTASPLETAAITTSAKPFRKVSTLRASVRVWAAMALQSS